MDFQKNFFIFICLITAIFFWYIWKIRNESNSFYHSHNIKNEQVMNFDNLNIPKKIKINNIISVQTDVLNLFINKQGGNISYADLLQYKTNLGSTKPLNLLNQSYQAQISLIKKNEFDNSKILETPLYLTSKNIFKLEKNNEELKVPMKWMSKDGILYVKTFIFKKGQYAVDIQFDVYNITQNNLIISIFGQLRHNIHISQVNEFNNNHFSFQNFQAAYSTTEHRYTKYSFDSILKNQNIAVVTCQGWIAMLEKYFATALIPQNQGKILIYTKKINNSKVIIGYKTNFFKVRPYIKYTVNSKLWIGPEIQEQMALTASYLDLTVDYGWLWFFSQPLFKLLYFLNKVLNNWGFSIIAITFLIKLILFPLSKIQYLALAKMRILQPQINEIKLKYANDAKQMNIELMNLYRNNKINPLGGCLPVLLQMPIFLALYYMLMSSVELRHAPFILWIQDLSDKDPYYILPIILGFTMFCIQKNSSSDITDIVQKKVTGFMPIIFTLLFLWFPSGLVLYYIINNVLTLIQQQLFFIDFNKKF